MNDTAQTQQNSRKEILISHQWIVKSGIDSIGVDMDKVGSKWNFYPNGTLIGVSADMKDSATVTWEITPNEEQLLINSGKGGQDECNITITDFSDISMKVTITDRTNKQYYFTFESILTAQDVTR